MEQLVESFIKDFCQKNNCYFKNQATAKRIFENRGIKVESDKSDRRFDFAIFKDSNLYLIETNFYA